MRHFLVGLCLTLVATAAAVGAVPLPGQAGTPGHLDSREVVLAGPGAAPLAPATGGRGRAAARTTTTPAAAGWSADVDVLDGAQLVGLSWDGATSARLAVRSRRPDGNWSAWTPLVSDPDERPDTGAEGGGRTGIGPIWLGSDGAERVEIRVDSGRLPGFRLRHMRWTGPVAGRSRPAGAAVAQPGIQSRAAWGAPPWKSTNSGCLDGPKVASELSFAVIHHTVNSNSYTADEVPGLLQSIYAFHTGSMGWCDVAYNFIVDRFGTIWQGRSGDAAEPVIGGHARGFNTGSVGISLLGQYEPGASPAAVQPSTPQMDAVRNLVAWTFAGAGLSPASTVTVTSGGSSKFAAGQRVTIERVAGHRDISYTACPGQHVYDRLDWLRGSAADLIALGTATPPPPVPPSGPPPPTSTYTPFADARSFVIRQYQDFHGRTPSASEISYWVQRLESGTSRYSLLGLLLDSTTVDGRQSAVTRLYLAYFLRDPDSAGLRYWSARRAAGTSLRFVSSQFAGSPEFAQRYGSLSDTAFVTRVYQNVMARDPDSDGLSYWTGRLRRGSESRGGLMAQFSESAEFRGRQDRRVDVIVAYDAMLAKTMTLATLDSWTAQVTRDQSMTALFRLILGSANYADRVH